MARESRVYVTVTREMRVALEWLSERSGLAPTTQAMVLLRQALDRTINGREVQERIKSERAQRTSGQWNNDQHLEAHLTRAEEQHSVRATQSPDL